MKIDKLGKEPKTGDLVLISNGNYLCTGIFTKFGSANNLNYVNMSDYQLRRCKEGKKPYNNHLNTNYNNRWLIINKDLLTTEESNIYDKLINYIK
jgi:hypothetical protein